MLLKKIILLLTVWFANYFSFAQSAKNIGVENNYQCISWGTDQGLSIGNITAMLKDRHGFLWIGTNVALNRFDGSHFTNYFPDKNKNGAINSGNIRGIVGDSLGNIWIGTSMGLSRYDNRADTFSNFSSTINPDLNFAFIIPFGATHDEVFCIEKSSQITAYNIYSFKKRIVVYHFDDYLGNDFSKYCYSILDADTNCVWILDKGGLLEVSLISGEQKHYILKEISKNGDNNETNYISVIRYDPGRKLIWLNTDHGLFQFTLTNKKFIPFEAFRDIQKPPHFWPFPGIGVDPRGMMWISTDIGIYICDPTDQKVKNFLSSAKSVNEGAGLIYCDPEGIVWTANSNAEKPLAQYNPTIHSVTRYVADTSRQWSLSHKHVSSLVKGPQQKLWIGTWDGMDIFDPVTGLFKVLREKDLPGFKGKNIIPVVIDNTQQKAWIKAWPPEAMYEMDIRTHNCRRLAIHDTSFNHRLKWDIVSEAVQPFQKGIIFPIENEGIFSVKKDSLVAYQDITVRQHINRMVVADDHLLFLKLSSVQKNLTYTYLAGKWVLTSSPLDSIAWTNIFFNKIDQTYWVGSFKEIIHYNKHLVVIRRYADGFPGANVLSILPDDDDNIWFANGTRNISRLNPVDGKFITLSVKDGFQRQVFRWEHPTVKDEQGDLYFAGTNGIDRVRPGYLRDTYPPSSVYIQSIEVNERPFSPTEDTNHLKELTLNYDENNINIEMGILDYYSEGNSFLRYKLEGIDENWHLVSNQYILRFGGLPSGKHRLIMQASNAVNDFNGPEKILLIYISPAFWNTWWFYVLIGMSLTTAIYILFRYRLQQKINLLEMRNQISQDLHDDIGGSISGINLLSQMASDKLQNNDLEEASVYLDKVKNYTQDVIEKLSDTVWIFNPQNDSIEKLLQRLHSLAVSIASSKNIKLHFETEKVNETRNITLRERKAIYLISKEALNNIFKYAACSNIYYSLHFKVSTWRLIIKDDGTGFVYAENGAGNGLRNMKARADEIGATFNIQSQTNAGTTITVEF